jgi:hypothetical protein
MRATTFHQYLQLQVSPVPAAIEVRRTGILLVLLETDCEHLVGQPPAYMPQYESNSLMILVWVSRQFLNCGVRYETEHTREISLEVVFVHSMPSLASIFYPYNSAVIPMWPQSSPRGSSLSHMHFYAAQDNARFSPYVPIRKPQLIKKPVSLPWVCSIHAAPPSFIARSWRGAARHFPPLDFLHRFLSLNHAYAALGSCGLVVLATSPFVAPSATSTDAGNCP